MIITKSEEIIEQILAIIQECEFIQESKESTYTKQCAKLSAYNDIVELIREYDES